MTRSPLLFPIAALLAACGGGTPAPAAPAASADPAPAAAAPPAAAPKDNAAVEQCLATANAKRARFSGEPAKVGLRHILVKYKGAKNAAASITRSREEACLRALEAREKLRNGADFDAMVKEYSEEPGAAGRNGSLGTVERKDVVKPFADAAFELSINQMSDIVETDFGFHLIYRYE